MNQPTHSLADHLKRGQQLPPPPPLPPAPSAASASPDDEEPASTAISSPEALKLAKALRGCLDIPKPEQLPARKLQLGEGGLTTDEEHRLFETVRRWALDKKFSIINMLVWQRDISRAREERPWPTAEQIWQQVVRQGLSEDPHFVVDEWLEPVLITLCMYFARDEERFEARDPDPAHPTYALGKGIMLFGPIGCGKTRLLELLSRVDPRLSFKIHACPDISGAYKAHGEQALVPYTAPVAQCFDDLGFEGTKVRHYGDLANPLEIILAKRYRLNPRPLTHCTTNLDVNGLAQAYDARVVSRMSELFNVVQFSPDAPDRRTL